MTYLSPSQVEQFQQSLDSDGEQPTENSLNLLKSFPLTVDTSSASFPMESPSALLGKSDEEDEDYDEEVHGDEDEFSQEGNESGEEERPDSAHKSFMAAHHKLTLALCIATIATILVLVILTLAAFVWTRMRIAFSRRSSPSLITTAPFQEVTNKVCSITAGTGEYFQSGCLSRCFWRSTEPQLIGSLEDLCEDCSHSSTSSKLHLPTHLAVISEKRGSNSRMLKSGRTPPFYFGSKEEDKLTGK